jgi:hypothetical protein
MLSVNVVGYSMGIPMNEVYDEDSERCSCGVCDYTWFKGFNGAHNCIPKLQLKIKQLETQLAAVPTGVINALRRRIEVLNDDLDGAYHRIADLESER